MFDSGFGSADPPCIFFWVWLSVLDIAELCYIAQTVWGVGLIGAQQVIFALGRHSGLIWPWMVQFYEFTVYSNAIIPYTYIFIWFLMLLSMYKHNTKILQQQGCLFFIDTDRASFNHWSLFLWVLWLWHLSGELRQANLRHAKLKWFYCLFIMWLPPPSAASKREASWCPKYFF